MPLDDRPRRHLRPSRRGEADLALVPFENSIEGSVRPDARRARLRRRGVTIAGEHDQPIRHSLIARERDRARPRSSAVLSHPQVLAQCARFLRERAARGRGRRDDVEPPRRSGASASRRSPWAAIGAASAADLYGCEVLRERRRGRGRQRHPLRLDRPRRDAEPAATGAWRTTLVFSELGRGPPGGAGRRAHRVLQPRREPDADRVAAAAPGSRAATCSSSTSRARRRDPVVAEAIEGLRGKAESVRILGSYPVGSSASARLNRPARTGRRLINSSRTMASLAVADTGCAATPTTATPR